MSINEQKTNKISEFAKAFWEADRGSKLGDARLSFIIAGANLLYNFVNDKSLLPSLLVLPIAYGVLRAKNGLFNNKHSTQDHDDNAPN